MLRRMQPANFPRVAKPIWTRRFAVYRFVVHRDGLVFWNCTFAAGRGQRIAVFAKGRRTGQFGGCKQWRARSLLVVGEIGGVAADDRRRSLNGQLRETDARESGFVSKNVTTFPLRCRHFVR